MDFDEPIRQLMASIWETMLKLPIEDLEAPPPCGERTVSACVHLTGEWQGAVALSCGADFARQAAGIMFNMSPADATPCDLQDALGELVNMVGGNIKGLLPDGTHLSLPAVVEGTDYSIRIPGGKTVSSVALRSGNYPLIVAVMERETCEQGNCASTGACVGGSSRSNL